MSQIGSGGSRQGPGRVTPGAGRGLAPLAEQRGIGGGSQNNINNINSNFRSINQITGGIRQQGNSRNNNNQGGVFLTAYDNGGDEAEPATEEYDAATPHADFQQERANAARLRARASMGQKSMIDRVQRRKQNMKQDSLAKRKHEEALTEMNRRKQLGPVKKVGPPQTKLSRGAGAGIKTTNRHLADFQNMKNQFNRKKEVLMAPVNQRADIRKPPNIQRNRPGPGSSSPRNGGKPQAWNPNAAQHQQQQQPRNTNLTRRTNKPMPNPSKPLPEAVDSRGQHMNYNNNNNNNDNNNIGDFGLMGNGAPVQSRTSQVNRRY
jgi:hypothetical protein